jgi:hypothetical protein
MKPMDQVALVGLRHFFRPVADDGESGRGSTDLRSVQQLDLLSRLLRGSVPLDQLGQNLVDLRGGYPHLSSLRHLQNQLEHLPDALTSQCGDIQKGNVPKKRCLGDESLLPLTSSVGVFLLDQVPLIHQDDQSGSPVPGLGRDPKILIVHADGGIHHQHADVGPFNGAFRPQRGVELQVIFYFSSTT